MFGRDVRTKLGLVRPDVHKTVENKLVANEQRPFRIFQERATVMAKNYRPGPLWIPGIVEEQTGPVSYRIRLHSGIRWRRHADQLRPVADQAEQSMEAGDSESAGLVAGSTLGKDTPSRANGIPEEPSAQEREQPSQRESEGESPEKIQQPEGSEAARETVVDENTTEAVSTGAEMIRAAVAKEPVVSGSPLVRRSARVKKPPAWTADYVLGWTGDEETDDWS